MHALKVEFGIAGIKEFIERMPRSEVTSRNVPCATQQKRSFLRREMSRPVIAVQVGSHCRIKIGKRRRNCISALEPIRLIL